MVNIDRISKEARQLHFGRTLLTLIAAVLYGLGWLVARIFVVLWLSAAWTFTALKLGWQDGLKSARVKSAVGPA